MRVIQVTPPNLPTTDNLMFMVGWFTVAPRLQIRTARRCSAKFRHRPISLFLPHRIRPLQEAPMTGATKTLGRVRPPRIIGHLVALPPASMQTGQVSEAYQKAVEARR